MHFSNSNCSAMIFSSFSESSVDAPRNIFSIWMYVGHPSAFKKWCGEISLNKSWRVSVKTGAPTDEVCSLVDWLNDSVFKPKSPELRVLIIKLLLDDALRAGDGASAETFLASRTIFNIANWGWAPPCLMYFSPISTAKRINAVWMGENGGASWFRINGSNLKNKTWAINFASAESIMKIIKTCLTNFLIWKVTL